MWELEQVIPFLQELEKKAVAIEYHVGLTGGVLYKGKSSKDLDVIIYPHRTTKKKTSEKVIEALGLVLKEHRDHKPYRDDKEVWQVETPDGSVIDLFFLK